MSDAPPPIDRPARPSAAPAVVAVLVLLAFCRLIASDFTYWDDQGTVHHNPRLNPPTFESLRFYWTNSEYGLYVPVTYTAWAALARIAFLQQPDEMGIQLNPWVFHAANVLVHLASAILVLRLLGRLIGRGWPALVGALVFALHPVQVESVGWVSGLKDLLCWAFALAALLVFVRRAQAVADDGERAGERLWATRAMPLCAALMALGILSKPTAIVVPAAMWAIDALLIRRRWGRSLRDLAPLFVLSLVGAVVARVAQGVEHVPGVPLWQRPFVVGDAFAFYVGKILWPATLTIDYGRTPRATMATSWAYVAWLVPAALLVGALAARRRAPALLAAAAVFAIGIAPVSGVTTFQMQLYSTVTDHYLYLSMLGPALLAAWAVARWRSTFVRVAACAVLAALATRTFVQCGARRDDATLFTRALAARPGSSLAHNNLANNYINRSPSRPDLAEPHTDAALAITPRDYFVLNTYAAIKATLGKKAEAIAAWERSAEVLRADPRGLPIPAEYAASVAMQLLRIDEPERALRWAEIGLATEPQNVRAKGAARDARQALTNRPTSAPATIPATTAAPAPARATTRP